MRAIEGLPKHDTMVLSNLQVLIASGLESRRKGTVDATIRLFNETFGKQDTLGYPKRVKSALRRLRPIADISLPSFPEDTNEDEVRAMCPFDRLTLTANRASHRHRFFRSLKTPVWATTCFPVRRQRV